MQISEIGIGTQKESILVLNVMRGRAVMSHSLSQRFYCNQVESELHFFGNGHSWESLVTYTAT